MPLHAFLCDEMGKVGDAAGIAPLVVVPGHDLDHVAAKDHRRETVNDSRVCVTTKIAGDQWLISVCENAVERTGGGLLVRVVESFFRGLLAHSCHEIDN